MGMLEWRDYLRIGTNGELYQTGNKTDEKKRKIDILLNEDNIEDNIDNIEVNIERGCE